MSEPHIYGNLDDITMSEAPIYGNLDDFSNIYTDEDFEAAAARLDLPALPPKPQKRASWFQGMAMNIKNETKKEKPENGKPKKKKQVVRKRKESVEIHVLPSPVGKSAPPNPPERNSISSKKSPEGSNKSNTSGKCFIITFFLILLVSGAGVVVYFKYADQIQDLLCFVGYAECKCKQENWYS